MFVYNINPVLLKLGFLEIRYYGLVYVIGFLLVYYILRKHKKEVNLTDDLVDSFMFYLFIGMFIGSRLFYFIFQEPQLFLKNPLEFFMIWHGGMAYFGGLITTILAIYIFVKKHKLDFYRLADIVVIPVVFATALGRIANFLNGELVGTVTNVPWCFIFPGYAGCRHPYQLYAALSMFLLFGVLLLTKTLKQQKGFVFWLFVTGYSGLRLLTDFFRDDPRFLALTLWQYFCIVGFIVGLIFINKIYTNKIIEKSL